MVGAMKLIRHLSYRIQNSFVGKKSFVFYRLQTKIAIPFHASVLDAIFVVAKTIAPATSTTTTTTIADATANVEEDVIDAAFGSFVKSRETRVKIVVRRSKAERMFEDAV